MRNVIVYVNLTFDGFLSGPSGELDWMSPDPVMNTELMGELRSRTDTILGGRKTLEAFAQHFRMEADDPASPPELVDFATWMLETPKVVFSRSTVSDLAAEVAELKKQPGQDMVLFGGVSTVREFVRQGLVDEYWIKLYPTAIGEGHALFPERAGLRLVHSKAYDSGIVVLRYLPA